MARSISGWRAASRAAFDVLLCAPLVLLTACGGGGGGGGGGSSTPAESQLVITASNAQSATADGLSVATQADAAEAGSSLVTGVQVQVGANGGPLQFARAVFVLAGKAPASRPFAQGASINQTQPCSLGGTMTITGNIATSGRLAVGDAMNLGASNCVETVDGKPTTMSGSLAIVVTAGSVSDTSGFPIDVTLGVTATNFTVATPTESAVTNGDMSLRVRQDSSTASSLTLSGNALSNTVSTATGSRSYTQRSYSQTVALSGGIATFTFSADVETNNSRLGTGPVSYSVRTPAVLVLNAAGDFTAGSISITGKASSLLATVTATNTFQIQVDANGDGSYESTTTATTTQLRALL